MAVDAMEIDSNPVSTGPAESEKERKRKHKHKDKDVSPSKKKRKHESAESDKKSKKKDKEKSKTRDKESRKSKKSSRKLETSATSSTTPSSPYSLTTATLYLPLSPISISPTHALASLLAEHLSPLLLTYYPPLQGIVLAYSNASISSSPPTASSASPADPNPQPLTLATTAGEYGVMYVYLTATFLVFRPQRGQILEGWVNVQSEGFLGAVVLNLFSVGIERKRLPSNWKWIPPGEEEEEYENNTTGEKQATSATTSDDDNDDNKLSSSSFNPDKEHFKPVTLASEANPLAEKWEADATTAAAADEYAENTGEGDDDAAVDGHFQSVSGHRVRGTVKFRVVDIDVIPGTDRDHGFLSIEGTMLSPEEEAKVVADERNGVIAPAPSALRRSTWIPQSSTSGALVSSSDLDLMETPSKKRTSGPSKLR